MLPVIERQAVAHDAPCTTPQLLSRFIQRNAVPGAGERKRRRATGPAAADDRNR